MKENNDRDRAVKDLEKALAEESEQRYNHIMRRSIPEKKDLLTMLMAMTKQELDDIRYNLCVSGISTLKKADMAAFLVSEVIEFSKKWFVTIGIEQYDILTTICHADGLTTELSEKDMRLDYMRCLGILSNGAQADKMAWYMPDEILAVYKELDKPVYKKAIEVNDEIMRLTTGLLFYYGFVDYDKLFLMVNAYLEKEDTLKFADFMGVMFNGACWQDNVVSTQHGMYYYTVLDPDKIERGQNERVNVDYAELPYDKVYEAGEVNYIEATDAYKALAQFFMKELNYEVLEAADIVGEITIILQNGGVMKEVVEYLDSLGIFKKKGIGEALVPLLTSFNNMSHLWLLKGHTPQDLMDVSKQMKSNVVKFESRSSKVGRNDLCPCGSGKKYKKCCLGKQQEKEN